jgi:hypothetical protein
MTITVKAITNIKWKNPPSMWYSKYPMPHPIMMSNDSVHNIPFMTVLPVK